MGSSAQAPQGPDFTLGTEISALSDGAALSGHAAGEPVLLVRQGHEVFAIGAACTHYSAPLGEGLIVDGTVRCPWHHACFSLRTGEALRAPALNPVACWRTETVDGRVFVREKIAPPPPPRRVSGGPLPSRVVIVGGGAAGNAAAETLRREGYDGPVTLISADEDAPYDRPNLSKDYLAGTAPEEWIPLRSREFYEKQGIALCLGTRVASLDPVRREVRLDSGETLPYGALLLATGASPVRLDIPGAGLPHVFTLRSLASSRALIARAETARQAVVIGASFIGLEVAASLRARGIGVHVAGLESEPLERVLGAEAGRFVRSLHEARGVTFHLGTSVSAIGEADVTLRNGLRLPADLVVMGVGVRPETGLAEAAGLALDRGIAADQYLETGAPGVFAAGDAASWPDPQSGRRIRVEHWVVAERQGQTAARNILGQREPFRAVPFFWSQHYDAVISYVGHAPSWDRVEIDGSLTARDATVSYFSGGRRLAVATVGRDLESLKAELSFEKDLAACP